MNKILKLSAIALLASSTSLMAQSKSFEGVSLGLSVSAIGAEISGSGTSGNGGSGSTANSTSGSIGKVAEIAAIDASYGYAIGPNGLISIGASYTPGKAKAGTGTYTDNNQGGGVNGKLNVELKDPYTIYIAPTYVISKDAALYAKIGYSHVDLNVTATDAAALSKKPSDLDGITYAIGSKIMLNPNLYLGVEASITDYDSISATKSVDAASNISADVKVVQGTVAIGYKF
jgi:hypothetical protein